MNGRVESVGKELGRCYISSVKLMSQVWTLLSSMERPRYRQ